MAHHGSFSSSHSSHSSASPSVSNSSAASGAVSMAATASFSVFQEGPSRSLVFAPPLGTPELQSLVDLFIALDVPVSMKMEMIQRDFEAHTARTNERYKTYFVPAAATSTAAPSATITSPSTFTTSPSPIFHSVFESHFNQPTSVSGVSAGGSGSGSGSVYLDASPVPRSSPTGSDLTVASDSLFPLSAPMFPTHFTPFHGDRLMDINSLGGGFFPVTVDRVAPHNHVAMAAPPTSSAPSLWPAAPSAATPTTLLTSPRPQSTQRSQQQRQSAQPQRRRLSGGSSMQILTRSGEDVTHMSSRATRTHEERENTRLVRQRGACPDCRRKKTRCNPSHAGSMFERVTRAAPYAAAIQSGRAKEEAAAAKAAKASKEKTEGKMAVTTADPVFLAAQAPDPAILSGHAVGGDVGYAPSANIDIALDLALLQDSFDWGQVSDQGRLFSSEDLELNIAATLSMAMPSSTTSTGGPEHEQLLNTVLAQAEAYGVPPTRPQPHRPTDSHVTDHNVHIGDQSLPTLTATQTNGSSFEASCRNHSALFSDSQHFSVGASMTEPGVQPNLGEAGESSSASSSRLSQPLFSIRVTENSDVFGPSPGSGVEDGIDRSEASSTTRTVPGIEDGQHRLDTTTPTSLTSSQTIPSDVEPGEQITERSRNSNRIQNRGRLRAVETPASALGHQHVYRQLLQHEQSHGPGYSHPGYNDSSHASGLGESRLSAVPGADSSSTLSQYAATNGNESSIQSRAGGSQRTSQRPSSLMTSLGSASYTGGVPSAEGESNLRSVRAESRRSQTSIVTSEVEASTSLPVAPGADILSARPDSSLVFNAEFISKSPPGPVALFAGLAALVSSLIPAYLAWTAAEPSDDIASEVQDQLEKLSLGSAIVACQ